MANKGTFKIHIAINFAKDGCDLAFGYKDKVKVYSGKYLTKQRQHPVKVKTQVLLNENDDLMTCIGDDAEKTYLIGTKPKTWKYFDNAIMSVQASKSSNYDRLQAANGSYCDAERVFVPIFEELKETATQFAKKLIKEKINKSQIQWIVTANQFINNNQRAKDNMRQYMIKAGLVNENIKNQCLFISQADCAALAVFKNIQQHNDLKENDTYIVVDAEEDTVNVAFYELNENTRIFEMGNNHSDTNEPCGYNYIDQEFIKLLQDIFYKDWIEDYKKTYPSSYVELMHKFSEAKSSFYRNPTAKTHPIQLPDEFVQYLENKCQENKMSLKKKISAYKKPVKYFRNLFGCDESEENVDNVQCELKIEKKKEFVMAVHIWKCLFDSQIDKIINCIRSNNQTAKLKNIYLVGEFSTSCYFQQKMRDTFRYLTIKIPNELSLAAVTGAAYFGIVKDFKIWNLKDVYGHYGDTLESKIDESATSSQSKGKSASIRGPLLIVAALLALVVGGSFVYVWQQKTINSLQLVSNKQKYKINQTKNTIESLNATIKSLENKLESLNATINSLTEEKNKLSKNNNIFTNIFETIRNLLSPFTTQESDVKLTSSANQSNLINTGEGQKLTTDIEKLTTTINSQSGNISTLQQQILTLKLEISQKETTINSLQTQADNCKQISKSNSKLYKWFKKIIALIPFMNSSDSISEKDIENKGNTTINYIKSFNESMKQTNQKFVTEIKALEKKTKELENTIEELTKENAELKQKNPAETPESLDKTGNVQSEQIRLSNESSQTLLQPHGTSPDGKGTSKSKAKGHKETETSENKIDL